MDLIEHPKFKQFLGIMKKKKILESDDPEKFIEAVVRDRAVLERVQNAWRGLDVFIDTITIQEIEDHVRGLILDVVVPIEWNLLLRSQMAELRRRLASPDAKFEDILDLPLVQCWINTIH